MSFDLLYTCFKISDVKIKQIEYCLIKSADANTRQKKPKLYGLFPPTRAATRQPISTRSNNPVSHGVAKDSVTPPLVGRPI